MTLNRENELGRFLYAILKQLDPRSINWDLVAQDPVLLAPIRTGHAARMRYHRYRKTIDGRPTTRRNALGGDSAQSNTTRVSKVKKTKAQSQKEEKGEGEEEGRGRGRGEEDEQEQEQESGKAQSPPIKDEFKHEFTPDLLINVTPYVGDNLEDFDYELLTPRSDNVSGSLHPIAVQDSMPLFETEGCNPANLSLYAGCGGSSEGGVMLERSQNQGVSNFESAMIFQDFEGDDGAVTNLTAGWDDRFNGVDQF